MVVINATMVYGWFRELVKNRGCEDISTLHVSELCQCLRRSYFDRVSPAPKLDVSNILITLGNGAHYQLQNLLVKKGWKKEVEGKVVVADLTIVGHADLVAPDGTVVEIKTVGKKQERPSWNHIMQLNAYLIMLEKRVGYLIYISRDGHVTVFKVKPNKERFKVLLRRALKLHNFLKQHKTPPPERGALCNQCPYRWRCFGSSGESNE